MYEILLTTSKGLDELLLEEVLSLCPQAQAKLKPGQVMFNGSLQDAYKLCLWSRLANRVLLLLAEGECQSAEQLYTVAEQVNWSSHFTLNEAFAIDFRGTNRAVNNTQFGALKIKDAIADHFSDLYGQRPSVDKANPDIRIQARLWRQNLRIYLDFSGSSLHQRQYRLDSGEAPVKEHVASAMLMRSGWSKNTHMPLLDPMCGAGTVVIEAAMMAANMAPGLSRDNWGFYLWQGHDQASWLQLVSEAEEAVIASHTTILATDIDRKVLAKAKQNADKAGVFHAIKFQHGDATTSKIASEQPAGFIVSNPPYGERLGELTSLLPLFRKWGTHLKQQFQDWQLSLLTSNRDLLRQLKLNAHKEYKMMNGKLECQLVNYQLDQANCEIRQQQTEHNDFANRLRKNIKRLNKWKKTQDIDCYRLYDADLPDYNVAVDRYADWLVVQEYAAPKDVPEQKARRRLHEVLISLPEVTGVAAEKIALKTRTQQKGKNQYEKVAEKKHNIEVFENSARFWVNPTDYLDTGLFLDHRITRQKVRELAKGKDVLNLFAYTGSVSVFAALGKARSVTTVDMSRTYLDWAKDNFKLNQLRGAYEFVQADCLDWLASHQQQYDLIFIDPPSFSNSKRMQTTWDVQRDHIRLLTDAVKCLRANGKIIFSNNLRQFKLQQDAVNALGLQIENITASTIPLDFERNPKIHHCWILTLE